MSYPDVASINSAQLAAAAAAERYSKAGLALEVNGDPVRAAQLLDDARKSANEAKRLVSEQLLAAAELDLGTLSNLFSEDYRERSELRAAAVKLLNPTDGAAGDSWRSHTNRRAEAKRRSTSTHRRRPSHSEQVPSAGRPDARVVAMYSQAARLLDEATAAANAHLRAARLHDTAPVADPDGQLNALVLRNATKLGPAARLLEAAVQLDAAAQENPARRLLSATWNTKSARPDNSMRAAQAEWSVASYARLLFGEAERLLEESAKSFRSRTELEAELRATRQLLAKDLRADAELVRLFDEARTELYDNAVGLLDEAAEAQAQLDVADHRCDESSDAARQLRDRAASAEALIRPFARRREQAIHREEAERLRAAAIELQNETYKVREKARDRLHAVAVQLFGAVGHIADAIDDRVARLLGEVAELEADKYRSERRSLDLYTAADTRRATARKLEAEWPRPRRRVRQEADSAAAEAETKWRAENDKGREVADAAQSSRRDIALLLAEAERLSADRLAEAVAAEALRGDA